MCKCALTQRDGECRKQCANESPLAEEMRQEQRRKRECPDGMEVLASVVSRLVESVKLFGNLI